MFDLRIPVTAINIAAIKAHLQKTLPDVKSSHRVEALARSLGFSTYASLRAAADQSDHSASPDATIFRQYLQEHKFEVRSEVIFHAVANAAIRAAMEKMPRLTSHGMGIGPVERHPEGRASAVRQHNERFKEAQEELLTSSLSEQFLLSLAFLKRVKPIKSINRSYSSYGLKHIAENFRCSYPTGERLGPTYVSNGALIAAAVHAGFKVREFHDSPNTCFNMSNGCLKDLDCEIRTDGAQAQSRRRRDALRQRADACHLPINRVQDW